MLKITPGEWDVATCKVGDEKVEWAVFHKDEHGELHRVARCGEGADDAEFIAESGTVANECGFTPRELLQQRDALLEACRLLVGWPNCAIDKPLEHYLGVARSAIAACEVKS